MSGIELAYAVERQRPGIGVIVMSGYPKSDVAGLRGKWRFLGKPFDVSALINAIGELLAQVPLAKCRISSATHSASAQPAGRG
jgi:DNA-binding NtrC family response regulator